MRNRSSMSLDPISDVLRLTGARSVVSGGFAIGGKWAFRIPRAGQIVFSAIAQGTCWLRLDHQKKALRLEQGDIGLLSGEHAFVIGSDLTLPPTEVKLSDKRGRIEQIGRTRDCVVLSGRVSLNPSSAALLTGVLPSMIHVRAASPEAAGLRWLVEQLLAEHSSNRPGALVASEKLAEFLFIQILRSYLNGAKTVPTGWLGAVRDERVLRALRLIHENPGRDWKLTELARAAAMSRTRFAVHFKSVAGVTPLGYLGAWRMQLAQRVLREEDRSIYEIAESLGYTSESAFSNAFKRITGTAPRNYRRAERQRPDSERSRRY